VQRVMMTVLRLGVGGGTCLHRDNIVGHHLDGFREVVRGDHQGERNQTWCSTRTNHKHQSRVKETLAQRHSGGKKEKSGPRKKPQFNDRDTEAGSAVIGWKCLVAKFPVKPPGQ